MSTLLKALLDATGPDIIPPKYTPRRVVHLLVLLADISDPALSETVFNTLDEAVRHLRELPLGHPLYESREDTEAAILLYAGTSHLTLPFCSLPFLPDVPPQSLPGAALPLEALADAIQLMTTHFRQLKELNTAISIPHIIHMTPATTPVTPNAKLERRLASTIPRHVELQHHIIGTDPHPDTLRDLSSISGENGIPTRASIRSAIDNLSFTEVVITGGLHSPRTGRVHLKDILSHD